MTHIILAVKNGAKLFLHHDDPCRPEFGYIAKVWFNSDRYICAIEKTPELALQALETAVEADSRAEQSGRFALLYW